MSVDGWKVVCNRRRKAWRTLASDSETVVAQRELSIKREDVPRIVNIVSNNLTRLRVSQWWEHTQKLLANAIDMRSVQVLACLGLGSFESSTNAREQLSCALLLRESFLIKGQRVRVFDPAMTEADAVVLSNFEMDLVCSEIDIPVWDDNSCILMFMPHCHFELYAKVIEYFRQKGASKRIVLLGNCLKRPITYQPNLREFESYCASASVLETKCLDAKYSTCEHAFNDLAITTFE